MFGKTTELAEVTGVQPVRLFRVLAIFKIVYLCQLGTSVIYVCYSEQKVAFCTL